MSNFKTLILILPAIIFINSTLYAKSIGVGIILGAPTGLSVKYNVNDKKGIDLAIRWKLSDKQEFYLHSNYLLKKKNFIKISKIKLNLFFGGGLKLLNKQTSNTSELLIALRAPVGVSYTFTKYRAEVFSEITSNFNISPESGFAVDFAIGARYYL